MQYKASKRPQRRIAVALDDPGPGECFARPGNTRGTQQDESRSALPSGHGRCKLLRDGHPYLSAGLDLRYVDAGKAVVDLKVCPPQLDQVRTALPGIGRERDDSRKFWSRLCLGKSHLFVGPWLVAIVRSCELDPGRDWLR